MSATVTEKISLEEFQANPDIHFYDFHELHDGEVVIVPSPTEEHVQMQEVLEHLGKSVLGPNYVVRREFYLAIAGHSRRINVGCVRRSRLQGLTDRVFAGSPELVIEVLSPSNTCLDADQLREACFREGALQFWMVNLKLRTVLVFGRDGSVQLFNSPSQSISLEELAPGMVIPLSAIFS